jgi:plasmid stabilization system protein ParE
MAEVRLRRAATVDLAEVLSYSRDTHGAEAARRYAVRFRAAFALLRQHPGAAPLLDWLEPPARSLLCGRHRILYEVEGETVWIGRILHVSRDLKSWPEA